MQMYDAKFIPQDYQVCSQSPHFGLLPYHDLLCKISLFSATLKSALHVLLIKVLRHGRVSQTQIVVMKHLSPLQVWNFSQFRFLPLGGLPQSWTEA